MSPSNESARLMFHGVRPPRATRLLRILTIAAAYYITGLLGLSLALPQTNATAVWIPSGIALAALLLGGASLWPGVALGSFLANAHMLLVQSTSDPRTILWGAAIISLGNTLEALLARSLFRRYIGMMKPFHSSRDPLTLALIAALSCVIASAIGVTTTSMLGLIPQQLARSALLTWWLGDLTGILVVTPLFLSFDRRSAWPRYRTLLLQGVFLAVVVLAAFLLFAGGIRHNLASSVAYLILPLVFVSAIWGKPILTQLSVAVIATVAAYGALHGQGPFVQPYVYSSLLLAQTFSCVITLAGSTLTSAIAERKLREQILHRTYRALQVLSSCNAAVLRAEAEEQLLNEVCRVAVDTAGYDLAWVGYAQDDDVQTVKPVAFAGLPEEVVSRIHASWGHNERGHGVIGRAVRTGRPAVAHDLLHNPDYSFWQPLIAETDLRSAAAVPLRAHNTTYGAIGFHSRKSDAFGESELALLAELGANLAYGILTLRAQAERAMLHEQVQHHAAELEQRVQQRTAELQQEMAQHESAQVSLRESERKYRELVEHANSIILRMDVQGRITFLNEFGQRFFGYSEEELRGRSVIGTIVPETETSGRDLRQLIQDVAIHPERHTTNENENIRRDGTRVWVSWTNRPIHDVQGHLVECLAVGNDITGLKQTEAELEKAKEAAEAADRIKSAFLATMSHELRTPLNSIIGFTGILLQELPGPLNIEQRNQLGMLQTAARHLLALINDVLDISKIEAGQLTIQRTHFHLPSTIDKILRTVGPLAQNKNLQLCAEISPEIGNFHGDQRRVEQILLNLLSNAIKFTERGQISLSCTRDDSWTILSVKDTGCGIAETDRATLFQPFRQLDTGLARQHEGTGLGLAICKRLLDLMGGRIELESEVGKGSVFTVRLPE